MNSARKISLPSAAIAAASLILLAHSPVASAAPIDDEAVKMGHSFELARGEYLLLARLHTPVTYRICIEDVPGMVPLEAVVDKKNIEVADGACTNLAGAHIAVRPSNKLPAGEVMVGHFEWVKK